jgi:hypothetical protein
VPTLKRDAGFVLPMPTLPDGRIVILVRGVPPVRDVANTIDADAYVVTRTRFDALTMNDVLALLTPAVDPEAVVP